MDLFGHDHEFTKLIIDLKGKDLDDAFSSIPYEKVSLPLIAQPQVLFLIVFRASTSSTT